jgi:hypothetical protein
MGNNNAKQVSEKENSKRRSGFKRILRISSRQANSTQRPISYAGINQYYEEHQTSTRPMSMIDVGPLDNLKTSEKNSLNKLFENKFFRGTSTDHLDIIPTEIDMNPISRCSSQQTTAGLLSRIFISNDFH